MQSEPLGVMNPEVPLSWVPTVAYKHVPNFGGWGRRGRGVAQTHQPGLRVAWGSKGRWFKSSRPD